MEEKIKVIKNDISAQQLNTIQKEKSLHIDLETTGLKPKTSTIKTIQIHAPQANTVFIVQTNTPPPNVIQALTLEIPKIFHHAMFDMRFIYNHWKIMTSNPKCTKIASKIISPNKKSHSLKPLLEDLLNIHIDKTQQLSNWSNTMLTEQQKEYAAKDVLYLGKLLTSLITNATPEQLNHIERSYAYIPTRVILDVEEIGDVFTY